MAMFSAATCQQIWRIPNTVVRDPQHVVLAQLDPSSPTPSIVVDERFCLRVADGAALPGVAPLLCAGITTYSPLKHWGAGPGKKVGVVGLGGLGHMGVKFARAFGAHVVLFTTSPSKVEDGKRLVCASVLAPDAIVVSLQNGVRNPDTLRAHLGAAQEELPSQLCARQHHVRVQHHPGA